MLEETNQCIIIDNEDGDVIKYDDYNVEVEKTNETLSSAAVVAAVVSNERANEEDADIVDETENDDDADDAVRSSAIELGENDSRASVEEKESIPLAKSIPVNVEVDDSLEVE